MKKKYIWTGIGIIVLLLIVRAVFSKNKSTVQVAYTVAPQDVRQTVLATGTVTPEAVLNLSFKNSGTIQKIDAQVGDSVHTGQVLAVLDQRDAQSAIDQAKAAVLAAQASYNKLINGASTPEIDVAQAAVLAAQVALNNAKTSYQNIVQQQQTLVANALSTMLNSTLSAVPAATNSSTATVAISGTYSGTDTGQYVVSVQLTGGGYAYSVSGIENGQGGVLNRGVPLPIGTKGLYITFSSTGTLAFNDSWTIAIPNTQASNYLANYNAYQTSLQTQTQTVSAAQGAVDAANAALVQAQAALEQKKAAPRQEDIQAAQAQVQTAQAQLAAAQNTFDNNQIVAPIDGVITSVDSKIGETIAASKEILIMQDPNALHVESDISESSISIVQAGQSVDMTLDAFGPDKHFSGQVISIDPASTVVQGVIDYRVVSSLPKDPGIKPGMTVNLVINISDTPNVLAVPNRLIQSNGSRKHISVIKGGKLTDITIQTGAVGDSYTQITAGLNPGDQIAAPPSSSGS